MCAGDRRSLGTSHLDAQGAWRSGGPGVVNGKLQRGTVIDVLVVEEDDPDYAHTGGSAGLVDRWGWRTADGQ